jgi:tetratricopeptide (TPR) repeat protein
MSEVEHIDASNVSRCQSRQRSEFTVRTEWLICLLLVFVIFGGYWQVRTHEFTTFDDNYYVTNNKRVNTGLSAENIRWAFSFEGKEKTYWHPFTWIAHMLDVQLFGLNPGMHLMMNTCLHAANAILLFIFLRLATGAIWRSALVALIFALHPLNVESVAWVAARKNVLSTFFWMLVLCAYLYYTANGTFLRYSILMLVFFFGLLTKPMLATLPFALLLIDFWPLKKKSIFQDSNAGQALSAQRDRFKFWKDSLWLILEKIPLMMLSAVLICLSMIALKEGPISVLKVSLSVRIENALVSYFRYLGNIFWPRDLAVFYPFPETVPTWQVIGSGLILISITWAFLRLARVSPYLIVGWLWFLGTLVPVSGLVQAGLWPAKADRFVYIPQIGVYLAIVWGLQSAVKSRIKRVYLVPATVVVLLLLLFLTRSQVAYWKNTRTLFERATAVTANNVVAHYNLGCALEESGRYEDAVVQYEKALALDGRHSKAHNNLGNRLLSRGQIQAALFHFQEALRFDPNLAAAHNGIAVVFIKRDETKAAITHLEEAIRLKPDYPEAHNNLGAVLRQNGRTGEAIDHYLTALKYDPDNTEASNNLGLALLRKGRFKEAQTLFRKVLRKLPDDPVAHKGMHTANEQRQVIESRRRSIQSQLLENPKDPQLLFNMGRIVEQLGLTEGAAEYYRKAVLYKDDYIEARKHLAITWAVMGRYQDAIDTLKAILSIKPGDPEAPYTIASIYARQDKVEMSLAWLKNAVSKGYDDWETLRKDANLANIRRTEYFRELITR